MAPRKNTNKKAPSPKGDSLSLPLEFLHSNKDVGSLAAQASKLYLEALRITDNTACDSAELKKAADKLKNAGQLYHRIITITPTSVTSEGKQKREQIEKGFDSILLLLNSTVEKIRNCKVLERYPDIPNATDPRKNSTTKNQGAAGTEAIEDMRIRLKIQSTRITRACGFRKLTDYAGGEDYIEFFRKSVEIPFKHPQLQASPNKIEGIMLFGPPGTGKTLLAEGVASMFPAAAFYSISASDIKGRYVGESEKSLRILFEEARKSTQGGQLPCVIFIDELDGLVSESGSDGAAGTGLLSQLNTEMEGLGNNSNKGLVVITATNYPERIPTAAVSRLKHKIFIGLPDMDNIREMIIKRLRKMGPAAYKFVKVDLNRLVHYTSLGQGNNASDYINNMSKKMPLSNDLYPGALAQNPDAKYDSVDILAQFLYEGGYASRDIDNIFTLVLQEMAALTYDFANNLVTDSRIDYQLWIMEDTKVMVDVEGPNGVCVSKPDHRNAFIPVGYTDSTGTGSIGQIFLEKLAPRMRKLGDVAEYMSKSPKVDPSTGSFLVVTQRTRDEKGNLYFKLVKQQSSPITVNANYGIEGLTFSDVNDNSIADRLGSLMGFSQFEMNDFVAATSVIKTAPIKNADAMVEYAVTNGKSYKKNSNDIARLAKDANVYQKWFVNANGAETTKPIFGNGEGEL